MLLAGDCKHRLERGWRRRLRELRELRLHFSYVTAMELREGYHHRILYLLLSVFVLVCGQGLLMFVRGDHLGLDCFLHFGLSVLFARDHDCPRFQSLDFSLESAIGLSMLNLHSLDGLLELEHVRILHSLDGRVMARWAGVVGSDWSVGVPVSSHGCRMIAGPNYVDHLIARLENVLEHFVVWATGDGSVAQLHEWRFVRRLVRSAYEWHPAFREFWLTLIV